MIKWMILIRYRSNRNKSKTVWHLLALLLVQTPAKVARMTRLVPPEVQVAACLPDSAQRYGNSRGLRI